MWLPVCGGCRVRSSDCFWAGSSMTCASNSPVVTTAFSSRFSPLLCCYIASAQCDASSFPFLWGSQRSPPLLSLRRGFIELPSVLGVSARQGFRPPFESQSSISLKETCVLIGHPSSIVRSLDHQWRADLSLYCRFGRAAQVALIAPCLLASARIINPKPSIISVILVVLGRQARLAL